MLRKSKSTSKSFAILSIITIIEKVLSFVYQAMIAGMIGANSTSDAYFTAAEFFVLIDSTLLSALVIVLLNMYTNKIADLSEKEADLFLVNIVRIVFPITVVLSVAIFIFSYPLSYLIGPGYTAEGRTILNSDIKYMALVPTFLSITSVGLAILRREKNFLVVGLKSMFLSTSGMIFVLIAHFTSFPKTNILCFGYVLAYFLYMVTVCFVTRKHRLLSPGLPQWSVDEKRLIKMLIPLVISNGILKVSMMIDKIICSTVGEGAVSCLTYSHTLYYFVEALFITNLSTVLLSDFNELSANGMRNEMANKISKAISMMILLLIPITIITVIYRYEIVRLVFMRGTFLESDVLRVGNLIMIYSIGFVPSVISNIYMNVHYAKGKTSITMKISLISIGINIATSIILSHFIGLLGIAVGTVISIVISVILYSSSIQKFIPEYRGFITTKKIFKLLGASIICVFCTLLVHSSIKNYIISFITGCGVGCISFLAMLLLEKEDDVKGIIDFVLGKIRLCR